MRIEQVEEENMNKLLQEKNIPQNNVNLKGAKKGEATSVAIMLLPSGNFSMSGVAIKLYIWFLNL